MWGYRLLPATLRARLKDNYTRPVRNYISNGARNDAMRDILLRAHNIEKEETPYVSAKRKKI